MMMEEKVGKKMLGPVEIRVDTLGDQRGLLIR